MVRSKNALRSYGLNKVLNKDARHHSSGEYGPEGVDV